MPRREPRKLDAMPDEGRVLIAHPSQEQRAIEVAREEMCDYHLTDLCPTGSVHVVNVDQVANPLPLDYNPLGPPPSSFRSTFYRWFGR